MAAEMKIVEGEESVRKKAEEIKRLSNLCVFEDSLLSEGYRYIAGVDEVGRGALAGPILAAAVILDRKKVMIEGLKDSKKLTPEGRMRIFKKILRSCISWSVAKISAQQIDEISLKNANILVVKNAVMGLKTKPDIVITDFISVDLDIPVIPLINGDEICASVAAASIIAKVVRDKIMIKLSRCYPHYGFEINKGYGTRDHLKSIRMYGPCTVHRMSFKGVLE